MNRVLGIDFGDSKVGLALTDPLGITVQGLETIVFNGNNKILLKRLDEIINEYAIKNIVIGMPINMNGTLTKRAEVTKEFIHRLKSKYNTINIDTIDERLTTKEANRTMSVLKMDRNKKKIIGDTIAAEYILEIYIKKFERRTNLNE